MLEAFVIIVALGGLEIVLWFFDHRQQKKQIELLDAIWAELAIHNSAEEERTVAESKVAQHPDFRSSSAATVIGGKAVP